jgi:acyl-CoA dehydrogenase
LQVLREILSVPFEAAPWNTLDEFWSQHCRVVETAKNPVDAAILGGFRSSIVATAFAAGYQAALYRLFPSLPRDCVVSLCVTERGGGHPRAILSRIAAGASGTYTLTGEKRWATLSSRASLLLVVARMGEDSTTNRADFRVVRVSPNAPGVTIVPMPETPFVPEIRHAEVSLKSVPITQEDMLPGDGYEDYVKPFRTVEDIHVHAAGAGYCIRTCRQYELGRPLIERFAHIAVSLQNVAQQDPKDAVTHIVLAGLLTDFMSALRDFDGAFAQVAPDAYAKFAADKPIFDIASRVRAERSTKAWERLAR